MGSGTSGLQRADVEPRVVSLGKLVAAVLAGKLRVPRFQRPFVWKGSDMLQLLDSVVRGYPIGSILVWETEEDVESHDRVGPVTIEPRGPGVTQYILDGQQRISTLVGALQLGENDAVVDGVDWRIYFDLDKVDGNAFEQLRRSHPEPRHFPVASLLDTSAYLAACRRITHELHEERDRIDRLLAAADRLASAFRDYSIAVVEISETDLSAAVEVFARLNRRGRRIAPDEMVSALTYKEGQFHLASRIDDVQARLARRGFGGLGRVFILRAVLAAMDLDIYAKEWTDLMRRPEVSARLPGSFEEASRGIDAAATFLRDIGVTSDRLLPYGLQLVCLAEAFRLCPDPSDAVRALLQRWFWVTSFTGWFRAVNSSQARRALDDVRRVARGERTTFEVVDLDEPAEPFPERFDSRSARVRSFLLYLASLRPRSLREGDRAMEPGDLLARLGTDALGHVLSAPDERWSGSPANRLFDDREHRGQAWTELAALPEHLAADILESHGFGEGAAAGIAADERDGVLAARLERLIEGERAFMGARGLKLPAKRTAQPIADSDGSDDDGGAATGPSFA